MAAAATLSQPKTMEATARTATMAKLPTTVNNLDTTPMATMVVLTRMAISSNRLTSQRSHLTLLSTPHLRTLGPPSQQVILQLSLPSQLTGLSPRSRATGRSQPSRATGSSLPSPLSPPTGRSQPTHGPLLPRLSPRQSHPPFPPIPASRLSSPRRRPSSLSLPLSQ